MAAVSHAINCITRQLAIHIIIAICNCVIVLHVCGFTYLILERLYSHTNAPYFKVYFMALCMQWFW